MVKPVKQETIDEIRKKMTAEVRLAFDLMREATRKKYERPMLKSWKSL